MRRTLVALALALRSCAPEPVYASYTPEECEPLAQYAYDVTWMKYQKWSRESSKAALVRYFASQKYNAAYQREMLELFDIFWSQTGTPDFVYEKVFNQCTGSLPS